MYSEIQEVCITECTLFRMLNWTHFARPELFRQMPNMLLFPREDYSLSGFMKQL